jgi:hypothetical protein
MEVKQLIDVNHNVSKQSYNVEDEKTIAKNSLLSLFVISLVEQLWSSFSETLVYFDLY